MRPAPLIRLNHPRLPRPFSMRPAVTVAVSAAWLLAMVASAAAGTIYVSPTGDDAHDGSSWTLAKRTVQAGLNAAVAGDQVWVAAGIYLERITLKEGVGLYGGLAGGEDPATFDLAQRDLAANETILDGNQSGSVVTAPSGATLATRIDGFTIRNGSSSGVFCNGASPTIANNTITANSVSVTPAYGGGIYCISSSPWILNNRITRNAASDSGGGIYAAAGLPIIEGNTIADNKAGGDGGGIYCTSPSATILRNRITGNGALGGGGIACDSASLTIANNIIAANRVSGRGGGIRLWGSATIVNNTITGNSATSGGGIDGYYSSSSVVANNIIAFNASGLRMSAGGNHTLRNNCVYGNVLYAYSNVPDPTGTDGNIVVDPKLAGFPYGNLHIQPDSPCRDAGDASQVQPAWTDIDGQSRTLDAGVDIGADESDGTLWPSGPYRVVRVSPTGSDALDGSSWALAKRTVQAAVDAAAAAGGEVWVKQGLYVGLVTVPPYVHLYGGFAGTETERAERNASRHPSILDGNGGGSVIRAETGHRGTCTIDGFTIRNGSATAGGGIFCHVSSPTIAHNTIMGNHATSSGGGAIFCTWGAGPIITANRPIGNSATGTRGYGGAIFCGGSVTPYIAANEIVANSATVGGGGIWCQASDAPLAGNTIVANSATVGGGLSCSSSSPVIHNSIIAFNSSGVFASDTGTPSLHFTCVFGNTAYDFSGLADPTGTNGNISLDPLLVRLPDDGGDGWGDDPATPDIDEFANNDYGDLHLLAGSPCINAGDPAFVPAPDETDIDGQPRVLYGRVDIGVDEYGLPGDADYDAEVSVLDIVAVVTRFGHTPADADWDPACDFDRDGEISVLDIVAVVTRFGERL